jgi:CUB/sushi domain-containing protein
LELCPAIVLPFNGRINSTARSVASVIIYEIAAGYRLSEISIRICQQNGTWSGTEPTCTVIFCKPTPSISDGILIGSYYGFGGSVYLRCNRGYVPVGATHFSCIADGVWSRRHQMHCFRKLCGSPGDILNGMKIGSDYRYNSVVTYRCDYGYALNGSATLVCLDTGKWNTTTATCVRKCPVYRVL